MKDKIDVSLLKALLRKQRQERASSFKKGNFDAVGFTLRILLTAAFLVIFAIFFGKFSDIYLSIKTDGVYNPTARLYELLSIAYTAILIFMVIGGVSQINRALFDADDMKLFSAMPVGAKTLYVSKLLTIYAGQILFALLTILPVNITIAVHSPQPAWYYLMTAAACVLLPLISIAVASLLALPYNAVKQFLKPRFLLNFIIVTAITAALFYLYAMLLGAVKEMLLGDELKYFFNERVMDFLQSFANVLYPGKWLANFMLKRERLFSGLGILIMLIVCLILSMTMIRAILTRALQSRIAGGENFIYPKRKLTQRRTTFSALVKKEFLQIFRTPSYMFSYFSVAVIMPMMVYFCMSVGASLVVKLIGVNCNVELAIFLTLLFGSLTNVFCTTNISRDGAMFYSVKAMPVSYKSVFFSKVFLCMVVTAFSQAISALLLFATGYLSLWIALFLFAAGMLCSFAQICFATRSDFNHAKFSTEEDGEIKESGNTVSTIIVLGMLASFLIGGAVLLIRMLFTLRGWNGEYITYLIVGVVSLCAAALAYYYLVRKLGKKYYEFSGGGLL